tara:strand:+ start:3230 stop:4606 length:1377 start_codon:yes stop_codon:yes gene_type:complete
MTISTTNSRNDYTASSSQTTFAYTFPVTAETDILVYQDGTLKSLTTHYTVSATPTGNVVFGSGLDSGTKVALVRSVPLTQSADYVENDPFSAETHEDALDRLTIIAQQIDEEVGRSLKLAASSTTSNLTIPEPSADKYLAWNSAADALENKDIAALGTVTVPISIANGGTGATSAIAARTALGVNKGSDIASANTLTVGTDGNYFDITGTTQINTLTVAANREFTFQFDGALVLQHHASNLDLPSEANITTAAGDVASFFSTGANTVQCVNYTRANGTSVAAASSDLVDDTSPQLGGALDCQGNDITAAGTIKMTEQADAESDTAGAGQIWVDTATPNRFMFTDDAGTDFGISPTFISAEQTVATDTALNVSHGLGAKPKEYTITLICKTADANYSVGDEIMVNNISHNGSDQGYTSCCDATNVSILQGEEIQAINKTGFDKSGLDVSDWRWIVRAWL